MQISNSPENLNLNVSQVAKRLGISTDTVKTLKGLTPAQLPTALDQRKILVIGRGQLTDICQTDSLDYSLRSLPNKCKLP